MQMTPMVRFALWFLRIYLLVLLALIALKFTRGISHPSPETPGHAPHTNTPAK